MQLQPNWLACNWRKVAPDSQYGRWMSRREAFLQRYRELAAWVEERGVQISPDQCEVTYVNHIYPMQGVWDKHSEAHRVFRGLQQIHPVDGVRPEQTLWKAEYLLGETSKPIGRLHINVQPAFSLKDDLPIFVMNLTARGAPSAQTVEGVMEFLDEGRRSVVGMFDRATTPEAHEYWGKE